MYRTKTYTKSDFVYICRVNGGIHFLFWLDDRSKWSLHWWFILLTFIVLLKILKISYQLGQNNKHGAVISLWFKMRYGQSVLSRLVSSCIYLFYNWSRLHNEEARNILFGLFIIIYNTSNLWYLQFKIWMITPVPLIVAAICRALMPHQVHCLFKLY